MRQASGSKRVTPRGLAAMFAAVGVLGGVLLVTPAEAIVGVEGTMEYAIDAPWRIEPSAVRDGSPVYGAIPIQISIHDANMLGRDHDYLPNQASVSMGWVCSVVVRERTRDDAPGAPPTGASTEFPFAALDEVEFTRGTWPSAGDASDPVPPHSLCRAWAGEDCSAAALVTGTSEWHAALAYPPVALTSVRPLSLQIEVRVTKNAQIECDGAADADLIRLINEVRINVSETALPRFGPGWLYGDLHYHSQGTDNEGESAYNYRGVMRAMGAMGLDFAFATEHASNSAQIVDIDAKFGDLFDFEFPPSEHEGGLRDMSDDRFRFLHGVLNAAGGANGEAGLITSAGAAEPAARLRPTPQIFLGGEVDMIPELPPGSKYGDAVPWGNHQFWSTENLCVGTLLSIGPIDIDCEFLGIDLLEESVTNPDAVLVDDIQGFTVDYGRHHIIYLPRQAADTEAFVRSDTGHYGGAHRRFVDMKPEIEAHGAFFAAHSISHYERGDDFLTDPGPTDIPWTDHLHDQVWRSPSFLGLQFWNEDARLREKVGKWDAITTKHPFPAKAFCSPPILNNMGLPPDYICPTPGDDIGYERYDSHIDGIPYAYLPVENAQAGFGSGLFHLDVAAPANGEWEEPFDTVEEKLHHGAFTWDRLNHWGLDIHKTLELDWLPSFLAPRRLFMAGGSDAHGDLNYRRTGYVIRTEKINDAALGKPRNLVDAGAPGGALLSRGPGLDPVAVPSQEQVAAAIGEGRFSITDGPALRIVVDVDRDGVIDPDEPSMGDTFQIDPTLTLPLLVEWKSTQEFGPVTRIDLYVGARSSETDLPDATHAIGRTYAPFHPGVFHRTIPGTLPPIPDFLVEDPPFNRMNDYYWEDPTGQLRIEPLNGADGTQSVVLDLNRFPAMGNRRADRFFVRAFAVTGPAEGFCAPPVHRDGCLPRYAFTNPIWVVEKSYLCGAAAGLDTVAPEVACNAPATQWRRRLPRAFTATAEDLCDAEVEVHDVECYAVHADGTRTQRRCVVRAEGDTIAIDRADGSGTIVAWQATATDPAGNSTTTRCQVEAVNYDPSAGRLGTLDRAVGGWSLGPVRH